MVVMSAGMRRLEHTLPWPAVLWRVDLDEHAAGLDAGICNRIERERAARMVRAEHRARMLASRHALRIALGAHVGLPPQALCIEDDAWGKPRLAGNERIEFNLSHSGAACLIAIGADTPIGVDIEQLGGAEHSADLALEIFDARELAQWNAASAGVRELAFLRCWTRKEACMKAHGAGLRIATRSLHVGCDTQSRHVPIEVDGVPTGATLWSPQWPDWPGIVAAVAILDAAPRA